MSSKDAIKRTGDMMLQGWKMLATSCPICHTALMSKAENLRCPGCDMAVKMENELSPGTKYSEAGPTPAARVAAAVPPALSAAADQKFIAQEPTSLEEMKREYDIKNKKRNAVSSLLGERMITGWTLLAETCPKDGCESTPLMKLGTGNMQCVSCNTEYGYSADGDLVNVKAVASAIPTAAGVTSAAATQQKESDNLDEEFDEGLFNMDDVPHLPLMSSFAVNKEDASHKISQKLLKGWSLLDKTCTIHTDTPLMKNHEGQLVCVQCPDSEGQTPGHSRRSMGMGHNNKSNTEALSAIAAAQKKQHQHQYQQQYRSEEFHHSDDEDEDDESGDYAKFSAAIGGLAASKSKGEYKRQKVSTNIVGNRVGANYEETLQILDEKLSSTAIQLANSGSNSEKAQQLARLISELAQSIKAVRSLNE